MKRGSTLLYLLVSLLLSISLSAQKKAGDDNYAHYNYRAAINNYLKAISSNPQDTGSLVRLAECYGILRDYNNAEIYYARAIATPGIQPYVYFKYGKILKSNGKMDEARAQFVAYSQMAPGDSAVKNEIRYCDNLKKHVALANYQVYTVDGINGKGSDFGPAMYNDNLVFVSDRGPDMIEFEKSGVTGSNFFKMYEAKPTDKNFTKPSRFSIPINGANQDFDIGPATFSADGKIMFFTQVAAIRKSDFVNQAKLYYCIKDGNNWGKPQPFQYNSDSYSNLDPALSADGQWLYFASNMPGGYGGTDIYECQKSGAGWSTPKNLGADVNTPGNEVFPYIRKDGTLFFSSDRHFSYGGLDIFSAVKEDADLWAEVLNLGPDINSSTDDFGICFNSNGRTGYFSSNRKTGTGGDDIYGFLYVGDYKPLKGKVLFSYNINDPAPKMGVSLVNDSGNVVATGTTDSLGTFKFTKLNPDRKYIVKVDESDPRLVGKKRIYLADSNGKIVSVTLVEANMGKFSFTQLPPDLSRLPRMDAVDKNINIAGNLLHGDESQPIAGVKINLLNSNGQVLESATTNEFGSFVFSNLPPDENYMFQVDVHDTKLPTNSRIELTDKNGNTIQSFTLTNGNNFRFSLLAKDSLAIKKMKVEDSEIRLSMKSKLIGENGENMPGVKVTLTDRNGNTIETTTTDKHGQYSFSNLPPDKTYFEQIDVADPKMKGMSKVYIADSKGNIIRELDMEHGFKYEILQTDKTKMGSLNVFDPWLTALNLKNRVAGNGIVSDSLHIIESIYYEYQKWDIQPAAARVLDKVVAVMQNDSSINIELDAFTDPRGSDEFNFILSQKRADAAVEYMVLQGIKKSRIVGIGFGKTRMINNCGDPGVICNEEQLAKNRRTEFKVRRRR
jgi:outer membrane protein OmpA-like peptidoglycan-associated protein/tetratricopeptide (TPR) repeat protein